MASRTFTARYILFVSTITGTDMSSLEDTSRWLYRHMDCTGSSMKMVEIRRGVYRELSQSTGRHKGVKVVISGSKGDGISKLMEGDIDMAIFCPSYTCINDSNRVQSIPRSTSVFQIANTCPGYCTLELTRRGTHRSPDIEQCLVSFNGKRLLSSFVLRERHASGFPYNSRAGPALTTHESGYSTDYVLTFTCECEEILKRWASRPRKYDWPPLSLRQRIPQMNGNLVATGMKGSETELLEWRYCFNEIEKLIVESLNDTQTKLYRILKTINNDIVKKRGYSLSSFMIKNTVLWLAETNHQQLFRPETLFTWIMKALRLLKHAAKMNYVSYYMIPERNLLIEKINASDRWPLFQTFSDVLKSGPDMLSSCETINKYTSLQPQEMTLLKEKLELYELCRLYLFQRHGHLTMADKDPETDTLYNDMEQTIRMELRSGWPPQIQQKIRACRRHADLQKMFLC